MASRAKCCGAVFLCLCVVASTSQLVDLSAQTTTKPGFETRIERLEELLTQEFAIGTVIFSLSETPPSPRWVPCEKGRTFPDDKQVPEALRGKPVPDMQEAVIAVGGTPGKREEGTLAPQTIDGMNFLFPAPTEKTMHEGKGLTNRAEWNCGFVGVFHPNGDYKDVKNNTAQWGCYGGQMIASKATYEYHPVNTKLKGAVSLMPPTHVFLRAYVRVR